MVDMSVRERKRCECESYVEICVWGMSYYERWICEAKMEIEGKIRCERERGDRWERKLRDERSLGWREREGGIERGDGWERESGMEEHMGRMGESQR